MNLFPEIEPFKIEYLSVDAKQKIYIEQSGNPNGIPVVFLHGGPGAGTSAVYRRFLILGNLELSYLIKEGQASQYHMVQ